MTLRRRLTSVSTLVGGFLLLAWLVTDIGPTEARRRRRRRAKSKATPAARLDHQLRHVGNPKVVIVRRANVKAFAEAAREFRKLSTFPSGKVVYDPATPRRDLLEDIEDLAPKVVLALGPDTARLLSGGLGDVPVLYTHLSRSPATTVRHGGWLSHAPPSALVLAWVRRVRPGAKRVAVIVPQKDGALARDFRRACAHANLTAEVVVAATDKDVVRAVAAALPKRPDALWLGWDVALYPRAVLRQLVRLQSLFRLPMVGVTAEHVRLGLLLAVDASPAAVGRAAQSLLREHVGQWLLPSPRRSATGRHGRRRVQAKPDASQLATRAVVPDRVSVSPRAARLLKVDLSTAVAAGAKKVQP